MKSNNLNQTLRKEILENSTDEESSTKEHNKIEFKNLKQLPKSFIDSITPITDKYSVIKITEELSANLKEVSSRLPKGDKYMPVITKEDLNSNGVLGELIN